MHKLHLLVLRQFVIKLVVPYKRFSFHSGSLLAYLLFTGVLLFFFDCILHYLKQKENEQDCFVYAQNNFRQQNARNMIS